MPKAIVSERAYMGIDPGQSGGVVVLWQNVVLPCAMESTEADIWTSVNSHQVLSSGKVVAMIEKVHSTPQMGVASSFKFGAGYGGLRMALIAAGIPFEEVTPQAWMKGLGIQPRKKNQTLIQWKQSLRARAQQMYPGVEVTLKTADALLIATYCKRKHEGTL